MLKVSSVQMKKTVMDGPTALPDALHRQPQKAGMALLKWVVGQFAENRPSGAKARRLFCGICGTTEVVPLQNMFKLTHYPKVKLFAPPI